VEYDVNIEVLKRLYYDEKLSVLKVSQRMGVPKHIIYAVMREHGLERRSKSEAQKLRDYQDQCPVSDTEIARLYYDEEKSTGTIAEELGVSQVVVRNRLIRAGYKLRSPKELRLLQIGGRALIVFSESEKESIRELYCEEGHSLATIGFRFNVSPHIIKRELINMGVSLRTAQESQELRRKKEQESYERQMVEKVGLILEDSEVSKEKIIQLWQDEKLKIQEIALKCSLSTVEVYDILREVGLLSDF